MLCLGCAGPDEGVHYTCQVVIDGTVARDIHLTLLKVESGRAIPMFAGSSTPEGKIILRPVDQTLTPAGPLELVGVVESTGSSQWQLAAPWVDPLTTPLKVKWPPVAQPFEIQLPRKAIRRI